MRKLLLFDVDGTLLSAGKPGRRVFGDALRSVFGTSGDLDGFKFEGKLDPNIVAELMRDAGVTEELIAARRFEALERYLDHLEEALATDKPVMKPGVVPLLESLMREPGIVMALLTGNLMRGARIKLQATGLWDHFSFGIWGDEAERRVDLGAVALRRAEERTGIRFAGSECVIVGDSRHDVECGLALGGRVVAVATGTTSEDDLRHAGAHVVLRDFSDLSATREAILG
jgi:phosphoglycolate phosphatase-like HAD superfamily hydrolase